MIRAGWTLPAGFMALGRDVFAAKEFWTERDPKDWSAAEVKEFLAKSPWAKEAEIKDNGQVGSLGSPRSVGRRAQAQTPRGQNEAPPSTAKITWKAVVRWDSALPVREALKTGGPKDIKDFYVLNVIGNLPSAVPREDAPVDQGALLYLKDNTKLQHKGDEIHLARVEDAPATALSAAGTYFYFSRMLALMPEDKEATFVTKIGPLDLKCKFSLRDMLYHGNLEL